jgi:cyanophycinase
MISRDDEIVTGYLLLEGGAEFGGKMAEPDLRAIQLAGGLHTPIAILPTAAAPDRNHERAGNNGLRWLQQLGATNITVAPVIDRESANREDIAAPLRTAKLIYMLGGFPDFLLQTLTGSLCWQAMLEAYQNGAVLGGSSAGAMVLCQYLYDPRSGNIVEGLNLLPNVCLLPHHNTFGKIWALRLKKLLPEAILIGIDEQTGIIDDSPQYGWQVYGKGNVIVYRNGEKQICHREESFSL